MLIYTKIQKLQSGSWFLREGEEPLNDTYTRTAHAVETYGGSAVGDLINSFSPTAAQFVNTYTGGLIPHTTQAQLQANRSTNPNAVNNRVTSAGDAANAITFGIVTAGVGKAALPYIKPILKKIKSKAYKINPVANKEKMQYLYRIEEPGSAKGVVEHVEGMRAVGKEPNHWLNERYDKVKPFHKEHPSQWDDLPRGYKKELVLNKYNGRWMETDPKRLDWYMRHNNLSDGSTDHLKLIRATVPKKKVAGDYALKNNAGSDFVSLSPNTERIVPRNIIDKSELFSASSYDRMVKEGALKPHWWKGYPKVIPLQ